MSSASARAPFQAKRGFPINEKSKHVGISTTYGFTRRRRCLRTISMSVFATLAILLLFTTHGTQVTVNGPTRFRPTTYETIPGFFAQSLNSTDDEAFDFVLTQFTPSTNRQAKSNFGLLDDDGKIDSSSDRWIRFQQKIDKLNANANMTESYKGSIPHFRRLMTSSISGKARRGVSQCR